ncbi:MAG: hypothetical protein QXX41_12660 [Nitrososphaerota archaeon]
MNTPQGLEDVAEHRNHEKFFKEKLHPDRIDAMNENEFREVYKTLWASRVWGNKDWYIDNKLIQPNGLEKIKRELKNLLYGSEEINVRYDRFRQNVKGFGPSSITEILHFIFPEKYCLWNEKPKTVLPFLGLNILPDNFFKYQIASGDDYLKCVHALEVAKNELAQYGVRDFIDLDVFFWYIYEYVLPVEKEKPRELVPPVTKVVINSHEAAEYYLLELGKMLGYNTYTVDQTKTFENRTLGDVAVLKNIPPFAGERDMNTVREIDVIWFGDDENPKMCFEVEHTTDIVHGLDRLVQLLHIYAKFYTVAPEEKRAKFEQLVTSRYPYRRFRDRFSFISYEDLARFYEVALPFYKTRVKLLGE